MKRIIIVCAVFFTMALAGCERAEHCRSCKFSSRYVEKAPVAPPKFEVGTIIRSKLGRGKALITALARRENHHTVRRYCVTLLDEDGKAKLVERDGRDYEFVYDTQIWWESEIELIEEESTL